MKFREYIEEDYLTEEEILESLDYLEEELDNYDNLDETRKSKLVANLIGLGYMAKEGDKLVVKKDIDTKEFYGKLKKTKKKSSIGDVMGFGKKSRMESRKSSKKLEKAHEKSKEIAKKEGKKAGGDYYSDKTDKLITSYKKKVDKIKKDKRDEVKNKVKKLVKKVGKIFK